MGSNAYVLRSTFYTRSIEDLAARSPCRPRLTLACTAPIRKLDPQALASSRHNTHNAQSTHKSSTMASLVQGGIYRVRYGTKTSSSTQRKGVRLQQAMV